MNTAPCAETTTRPFATWRLENYHFGIALIITLRAGRFCWMLDYPDAQPSAPHGDYPLCLAHARHSLGLPTIGGRSTP